MKNGLFTRKVMLRKGSCSIHQYKMWIGGVVEQLKKIAFDGVVDSKEFTNEEGVWFELSCDFVAPLPLVLSEIELYPKYRKGMEMKDEIKLIKEMG